MLFGVLLRAVRGVVRLVGGVRSTSTPYSAAASVLALWDAWLRRR